MLAQTYLPARKLGLKVKERDALIDILEKLETGVFIHEPPAVPLAEDAYAVGLAFNMATFNCGTTGCIAGWCDLLHGTRFAAQQTGSRYRPGRPRNLQNLFYVEDGTDIEFYNIEDVTPKQAAAALRNFLTLGKPYWIDALKQGDDHGGEIHPKGSQEDGAKRYQRCPA
jgi:hypothetical protein